MRIRDRDFGRVVCEPVVLAFDSYVRMPTYLDGRHEQNRTAGIMPYGQEPVVVVRRFPDLVFYYVLKLDIGLEINHGTGHVDACDADFHTSGSIFHSEVIEHLGL